MCQIGVFVDVGVVVLLVRVLCFGFFFFQAEDGIRDLVRSRGLGDVYKRQNYDTSALIEYIIINGCNHCLCSTLTTTECE